jgi:inner membrane protein
VDALSHALIASLLFSFPPLAPLIPFAVLGAVLPDADIFFSAIADRDSRLYLFTHGGIAHSIAGAVTLSAIGYGTALLLAEGGLIPSSAIASVGIWGFAAVLAGGLLHIAIDVLACPGIPLLAPSSDRKYTLGILPGPSILLAFTALGFVTVALFRLIPLTTATALYAGTVIAYLAFRAGMFLFMDAKLPGRKIPTFNPLRWITVSEDDNAYTLRYYTLPAGYSGEATFQKFHNTDQHTLASVSGLPDVQRFRFHAYSVTSERIGSVLILADPLREKGYLYYPPKYKRVAVTVE